MASRLSASAVPKRPSILDKRVSLATLGVGSATPAGGGYGQEDTKEEASRPVHTRKSVAALAARAVAGGFGGASGGTRATLGGGVGVQAGGGGKRFSSMLLPLPRHDATLSAHDAGALLSPDGSGGGGSGGPQARPRASRGSVPRNPSGRAPRPSSAAAYEGNLGAHQGNLI
jgi:hypothetical protein